MANFVNPTKVITGECTFSYLNCWDAKPINGSRPKFSVSLIIPKNDTATVEKIREAIRAAYAYGHNKLKGDSTIVPPLSAIITPLRDGDVERPNDETYRNSWFVNATSLTAPEIVDVSRRPIINHSEMYSGVKGRASLNFYAYYVNNRRGIAAGLINLQKTADGRPLGSRSRAEDDFATGNNFADEINFVSMTGFGNGGDDPDNIFLN